MAYVAIRIDEEAARVLNQYAANNGMTKSQAILSALKGAAPDEADKLLEELDAKSDNYVNPLLEGLDPDELPECCQDFLKSQGSKNCGHWEDRRPRGYYNTLTHKYASDPDYYQYL